MKNFFDKRDRWGNGMSLWVLVAMAFVIPIAWQSVRDIEIHNDVANWLPKDDPQAIVLQWYSDLFPIEDRFLLSWDDSSLADPRIDKLAVQLEGVEDDEGVKRGGSPYFDSVVTPAELISRIAHHDVTYDEGLTRVKGVLLGGGPLKVRLSAAGRRQQAMFERLLSDAAREQLKIDIRILERDLNLVEYIELKRQEVAEEEDDEEEQTAAVDIGHDLQISFPAMQVNEKLSRQLLELVESIRQPDTDEPLVDAAFYVPGMPAALSVALSEAGSADREAAFKELRRIAAEVGIAPETLRMGGRPVAGEELNRAVSRAAWDRAAPLSEFYRRSVILTSIIVGVLLGFIMLRSARLATLVQIVSGYTVFVSLALVPALGGSMNMVLVVMPTLLMVLTVSAAIHVVNYWKHAAAVDPSTAISACYRMARVPCGLAAFTTSVGLISLATSPLRPVRDFGIFSALGCLLSLVVVLFGLPSMISLLPARRTQSTGVDSLVFSRLGRGLARHYKLVSLACIVVFISCTAGLQYFRTETKVIRYFPDDSRVVQDYNFLEENLAGIIPVDTVVRFDEAAQQELTFLERVEIVRKVERKLETHRDISGTLSLADFLPETEKPDFESLTGARRLLAQKKYSTRDQRTRMYVDESDSAKTFLIKAEEARDLHAAGDAELNEAGDELWKITAQVAIMSDMDYGQLTRELDDLVQSETRYVSGVKHRVTGLIPIFLRTQQAVLESLIRSFALAFGLIAIVMMVLLRNVVAGLITMLPNLLPVGMVFGLISWCGLSVDIGTMITASVALGIAVDGTLHLLTWFRIGIMNGRTRTEAISEALSHCGPAMWQTSAAIGLGLLMLFPAELLLISRFGWLMAALIGTALIADVIFLPALLAGPLGGLIERSARIEQDRKARQHLAEEARSALAPAGAGASDRHEPGGSLRGDHNSRSTASGIPRSPHLRSPQSDHVVPHD